MALHARAASQEPSKRRRHRSSEGPPAKKEGRGPLANWLTWALVFGVEGFGLFEFEKTWIVKIGRWMEQQLDTCISE